MRGAPVFRSLLEPKLIFGLPYEMGLGILLTTLYLTMLVGPWMLLPIVVGVVALRVTVGIDHFAVKLYQQYVREGDVYEPFVSAVLRDGRRPRCLGGGERC